MNCKPQDMAFIVTEDPGCESNCGAVIRVLDDTLCDPGEWRCVCDYRQMMGEVDEAGTVELGAMGEEFWIYDRHLRPIRPGNVTDEEVRELFAPKQPETV